MISLRTEDLVGSKAPIDLWRAEEQRAFEIKLVGHA
jgi:hypothetical protein